MTEGDVTVRLGENGEGSQVVVITSQPSGIVCLFSVAVDVAELDATPFELIPIEPEVNGN
jgi:hypothetical protein